ncbi:hypothetical protein M885DRAFT_110642 [Pelagophyceae sp. CCMP2097]|nr:hypothetical protein M885DRAFT_110642 [Pelagophyceae sp. CCMP2097]
MATPLARLKALQPPTVALINVCDKGAGRAVLAGLEETVGKEMGVFGRILDVEAFDNGIVHVFFADVDNARRCADQLEGTRFDGRKIGAALFADGPPTGPRAEAPGGAAGDRVGAFLDEVLKSTTAASVEALKSTTTASDAATAAADKTATATAPDGEADDGAGEDGTASGCGTASFAATDDDAASWSSFDGGSASDDDSVDGDDASCGQRREREPDGAKPEWMTGALSAAELRRIISAKGASLARPAPKRTKPLGSALFPVANSDSARQRLCGVDAPEESDEAGWLDGPASKPSRSDVPSEIVGGWEEHERGIGSKLMRAMGYNRGEGLGKRSDGRICAPEAVRLHHGPDKAASKTPGLGDAAWREPPKPSERAAKKKRKRHEVTMHCPTVSPGRRRRSR